MNLIKKIILRHDIECQAVYLPRGIDPLFVRAWHGQIELYYQMMSDQPDIEHVFAVYETGVCIFTEDIRYIGTVALRGGSHILHVYKVLSDED